MTEIDKIESLKRPGSDASAPESNAPKEGAHQSFLDQATHLLLDPVASAVSSDRSTQQQIVESAKNFAKTVPLFMAGNVGRVALAALSVADEVKTSDSLGEAVLDATLGLGKAAALSVVKDFAITRNVSPSLMGVELGITNRASDTGLTRANYLDANGQLDLGSGLKKTAITAFNPVSIATDALAFAGADFAWGALNHITLGAARHNPMLTHTLAGGVFGFSSGAGTEIAHQLTTGEFDPKALALRTGLSTATGFAGGAVGGYQVRRTTDLGYRDTAADVAAARSTPFQKGEIVDARQQALRDGTFVPVVEANGAFNIKTYFGKVVSPEGHEVHAVFRANDGSPAFSNRMQAEIGVYGLDKRLPLDGGSPAAVRRSIEFEGQKLDGFIQEMRGENLKQYLGASVKNDKLSSANARAISQSDPQLMNAFGSAMLKRMVTGQWDNHALNLLVDRSAAAIPGRNMSSIDFDLVPSVRNRLEYRPDSGRTKAWDNSAYGLYNRLAGSELTTQQLSALELFRSQYNSAAGRTELQSLGFTSGQVDGMLGRTSWFVENRYFPHRTEDNTFHLLKPVLLRLKPYLPSHGSNLGPLIAPTL